MCVFNDGIPYSRAGERNSGLCVNTDGPRGGGAECKSKLRKIACDRGAPTKFPKHTQLSYMVEDILQNYTEEQGSDKRRKGEGSRTAVTWWDT